MSVINVLEKLASLIESKNELSNTYTKSTSSYNGFEQLVSECLAELIKIDHSFEYQIHFGHYFPDITIIYNKEQYGLELKSRNNGSWDNNGGSVFESISDDNYKEIFLMFGSLQKNKLQYQVKFDYYWKVVDGIKVTHKPRYHINMQPKHTVFNNSSEYKATRLMNETEKIQFVQQKLREQTTKPQWYLYNESSKEEILPKKWEELTEDEKKTIISEMAILFIYELVFKKRANYDLPCQYLISKYFYYNPSFRDIFTAGGKDKINNIQFTKMIVTLHNHKEYILSILENCSDSFKKEAIQIWSTHNPSIIDNSLSFKEQYFLILDTIGKTTPNLSLRESIKHSNKTLSKIILG